MRDKTSKHLGGNTELTVVMPIKRGLIDALEARTYASRLRAFLDTLNALRKGSVESAPVASYAGPIERLRTIFFSRFTVDEEAGTLSLVVEFDRPWEPYIRKISDEAGPILDAICCNCEGYEERFRTELGYPEFAKWVRKHQRESPFFYSALPDLTVDDLQYCRDHEQKQRDMSFDVPVAAPAAAPGVYMSPTGVATAPPSLDADLELARLKVRNPVAVAADAAVAAYGPNAAKVSRDQGLKVLCLLHKLREFYPDRPKDNGSGDFASRDFIYLHRTAKAILKGFKPETLEKEDQEKFKAQIDWYNFDYDATFPNPQPPSKPPKSLERPNEIQGNILNRYSRVSHGCLLLMRVTNPPLARASLSTLAKRVARYDPGVTRPDVDNLPYDQTRLNVAFTYSGLRALGIPDGQLATFPKEFREGMEARAGLLGDVRVNHPNNWTLPDWNWPLQETPSEVPVHLSTVDVVMSLQGSFPETAGDHEFTKAHPLFTEVKELSATEGLQLLSVQPMRQYRTVAERDGKEKHVVREHFGFVDGISQPNPTGQPKGRDDVSYGEVVLGYANDHDDPVDPDRTPLLHNGSFLVVRKMRQHIDRLESVVNGFVQQPQGVITADDVKAKLVGRYPDGTAAVDGVTKDNDFDYSNDSAGEQCPFHAHIRRANPRMKVTTPRPNPKDEPPIPRIVRRGMSYGPLHDQNQDAEKGLVFMAYNASIAEQFEVIQRWIGGGNSAGSMSAQNDALMGVPIPGQPRTVRFVRNGTGVERLDLKDKPFVTLQWGMYLFTPSVRVLESLAEQAVQTPSDEVVKSGNDIIEKLLALERENAKLAEAEWKAVLEDNNARGAGKTHAVWAAVRARGGVVRTAYGVLVGLPGQVREILRDPDGYSVREYWERMRQSLGESYLGMDPHPRKIEAGASPEAVALDDRYRSGVKDGQYKAESELTNKILGAFTQKDAFEASWKITAALLQEQVVVQIDPITGQQQKAGTIDLRPMGLYVLARLSSAWFGVPRNPSDPAKLVEVLQGALEAARYIFSPKPSNFVTTSAQTKGKTLHREAEAFVNAVLGELEQPPALVAPLFERAAAVWGAGKVEVLTRTFANLVQGFSAPTQGSFLAVMHRWTTTGELWRLQQALLAKPKPTDAETPRAFESVKAVLGKALIDGMQQRPVPDVVHRTAVQHARIGYDVDVKPGDRIVVGLESAAAAAKQPDATEFLFGGDYKEGASDDVPTHACSGREMGLGVVLGMICAVMESGELRSEGVPLVLKVRKP